jgi:hypothetical protein
MWRVSPNNWPSKDKWTLIICQVAKKYFATCHILKPYKMDDVEFSHIK